MLDADDTVVAHFKFRGVARGAVLAVVHLARVQRAQLDAHTVESGLRQLQFLRAI